MKRILIVVLMIVSLSACVSIREAAVPLGNDLMEIDVSAAPKYGRAGAMEAALKKAAQATINAGYDKFIVLRDDGWTESTQFAGSYGQATVNPSTGQASQSFFAGTARHPEVKLVIRMYHDGDEGSEKAVNARSVLKQQDD
jgi:hypothetical protein